MTNGPITGHPTTGHPTTGHPTTGTTDLWVSSGHHLLDRDADGRLRITTEFLKAYLARPEIVPPDESCDAERALHGRLLREPRALVTAADVRALADRDARENWRHWLAFRDALVAHPTIEAAYLALVRAERVTTPPLFLNQLVHLIARTMLDGETDPYVWRAAELLFRPQRLTLRSGTQDSLMLLADEEVVDGAEVPDRTSPLVAIFGDARAQSLDVLTSATAAHYASRSDAFDMVLDFRLGEPGRTAFARVLERWTLHLLGAPITVTPVDRFEASRWVWFAGLDAEGTRIGNALWRGDATGSPSAGGGASAESASPDSAGIVALFEARVADARDAIDRVGDRPFPLILGMTPNRLVRVKPQNLATGLPLRQSQSGHSGQ